MATPPPKIDSGDTAWLLMSSAMVLLMTPGLALFYGGMVRKKNVLSTFMHSMFCLGLITVQWVVVGYSLAFGPDKGGLIGGLDWALLHHVDLTAKGTVPHLAFMLFQCMFAIITPALISGAFAERIRFSAFALFTLAWATFVYDPVAHWVWADGGWLNKLGALDFAGGTVVHVTAGVSALIAAVVVGRRVGYPKERFIPHNLTLTVIGAGMLWFGWFGFNAGSALTSGATATLALVTTHIAAGAGALAWALAEWLRVKKPSTLGVASGLVAGLVAITPAAGYVSPAAALVIGALAGLVCYGAVVAKVRAGYDDSLDAFGVHGVGGTLGALLTGVFASKALNAQGNDGLLAGNPRQLGIQLLAVAVTAAYAAVVTYVLLKIIDKLVGLRLSESEEREGLDASQHGEEGYNF